MAKTYEKHHSSQNPRQQKRVKKKKRVFNSNDEFILLNGLLAFKSKTGIDPMKVLSEFYKSCKDSLSFKTKEKQFHGKIWKLKRKYEKNLQKKSQKKNQDSFAFLDFHEKKLFQLSNKLWGEENGVDNRERETFMQEDPLHVSDKMISFDDMCMNVLKSEINLIGESERREMDRRFKRLKVQEAKLGLQRAELLAEQVDLIYEGLQRKEGSMNVS